MNTLARPKLALRRSALKSVLAGLRASERRAHFAEILVYRWRAALLSLQLHAYSGAAKDAIRPQAAAPVFIVGYWRSGTTWLHELLALNSTFVTPTTRQCMNPATLLTPGLPASGGRVVQRSMDGVPIAAHTPQEDEFALLAFGAPSLYRALLAPRLMLDMPGFLLATRDGWQEPLGIVLECLHQPGRIALLKSPNHALRIDVLAAAYGEARFIAIARDPRDLLASNERMWLELFALYALGEWSRDWVRQFFAASYRLFLEQIRWAQATLPPERFACVTFDKLTAEPDAVLRRLHAQLRLPDCEAASQRIASLLATRAGHRTKGRQPGSEDGEFLEQALGVSLLREGCRLAGTQYP